MAKTKAQIFEQINALNEVGVYWDIANEAINPKTKLQQKVEDFVTNYGYDPFMEGVDEHLNKLHNQLAKS